MKSFDYGEFDVAVIVFWKSLPEKFHKINCEISKI